MTLVPKYLEPGTSLRILVRGTWANNGTPTRRWRIYLGGTVIIDSGANPLDKNIPTEPFALEAILVCRAAGTAGSVIGAGSVASGSMHRDFQPQVNPVTIDTTKALQLDLTVQWGAIDPVNAVLITHLLVWAEQPI